MKNILKTYPVVSTLTFICLLLGILTSIYGNAMYDLLAFHSKPVYYWQYMSGTLMHGRLLERKRGSKHVLLVFVTATVISSIAFHFLTQGQKIQATGISAVGYAFITGGVILLPNIWKEFSCTVKLYYLFLILLASLMLLPMITGWISTCLHLSGIASYLLVFIGSKSLRRRTNY